MTTTLKGAQIRIASIPRDRIDAAFEASLATLETDVAAILASGGTGGGGGGPSEAVAIANLQTQLNTEASTRTTQAAQEVTNRNAAIAAEALIRSNAVTALDTRVDALEGTAFSGITFDKLVTRETPTGVINGVNCVFVLANVPRTGTEQIYLNGILLEPGVDNDYVLTGANVVFNEAPLVNDRVKATYFV